MQFRQSCNREHHGGCLKNPTDRSTVYIIQLLHLGDIFKGSQINITKRYREPVLIVVLISGYMNNEA